MLPPSDANRAIEKTVREEWGRILAALVAHLGDLELAEDCLQATLISALNHWQKNGAPFARRLAYHHRSPQGD